MRGAFSFIRNWLSLGWWGEWQSTQLTLFCRCAERAKLLCSSPYVWHPRQRALISWAEAFLNVKIFVLSPPPSTCAFPGRSEERRVGKECRWRLERDQGMKNNQETRLQPARRSEVSMCS